MDNDKFQELVLGNSGKVFTKPGSVKADLESVKNDVQSVKNEVASVKKNQLKLEIRVEDELIPKIQALFDGYAAHNERLTRVEDRLEDVATDVRYLVVRVTSLERVAT